jgi:hypothetical protein
MTRTPNNAQNDGKGVPAAGWQDQGHLRANVPPGIGWALEVLHQFRSCLMTVAAFRHLPVAADFVEAAAAARHDS